MRGRSGRDGGGGAERDRRPRHAGRHRFRGAASDGTGVQAGSARLKRGVLEELTGAALLSGMTATSGRLPPARRRCLVATLSSTAPGWSTIRPRWRRGAEFRAAFGAAGFQHIGFGAALGRSLGDVQHGGGALPIGLFARTNVERHGCGHAADGSTPWHDYKIEWTPTQAVYSVDGVVRHMENATFTQAMRPVISDFYAAD